MRYVASRGWGAAVRKPLRGAPPCRAGLSGSREKKPSSPVPPGQDLALPLWAGPWRLSLHLQQHSAHFPVKSWVINILGFAGNHSTLLLECKGHLRQDVREWAWL